MFRSRKITVYEKKLIEAGINVKSMLVKNLLHRMIDVNYHHDIEIEIIFEGNRMVQGDISELDGDFDRILHWDHPRVGSRGRGVPDTSVWSIDEYYYEGFDSEYNNGPNGWGYDFYPGTLSSPDDWKRVDS